MKKTFGSYIEAILIACILLSGVAVAGSYSVSTTEQQDARLHVMLSAMNAERMSRAAGYPTTSAEYSVLATPISTEQFIAIMATRMFDAEWRRVRRRMLRRLPDETLDQVIGLDQ